MKCPFDTSQWDQRKTLCPPPFKGPMKRLLPGIHVGDSKFDALSLRKVRDGCRDAKNIEQDAEPEWVDWEMLKEGQRLFSANLGSVFIGLNAALMQGFSIARFADVLVDSGYTTSPKSSWDRYSKTAWAISDWYRFDLRDPKGQARQSVYRVRCMHTCARHKSSRLFDSAKQEGMAVSQYDLAEVQMGFSSICLALLKDELNAPELSTADKEAMIHCWRFIGHHLGIKEQFNTCRSLKEATAMMEEYMVWTPRRLETCRDTTYDLQRLCCEGFGVFTGAGKNAFQGFLTALQKSSWADVNYVKEKPLEGVTETVRWGLKRSGSSTVNEGMSAAIIHIRETAQKDPVHYSRMLRINSAVSQFMDHVFWPTWSYGYVALTHEPLAPELCNADYAWQFEF